MSAPFGGYQITFAGCRDTLEEVMGQGDLSPAEMTKRLWAYVKRRGLASKPSGEATATMPPSA